MPFKLFEQWLGVLIFEPQHLHGYLRKLQEEFSTLEPVTEQLQGRGTMDLAGIRTFCVDLLPIFYPFPPNNPWLIAERWHTALSELRQYFSWSEVKQLTNHMLAQLRTLNRYTDPEIVLSTLIKGFQAGLPAPEVAEMPSEEEKEAIPDLGREPLPNQSHYRSQYPQLTSIDVAHHPKITDLTILIFECGAYIDLLEEVPLLRKLVEVPRDIDIVKLKTRYYAVFSNNVNLSLLETFEGDGGTDHMYFNPAKNSEAPEFAVFLEEFSTLDYIDYPQFIAFLKRIAEAYGAREGALHEGKILEFSDQVLNSLRDDAMVVLTPFPPPEPQAVVTRWTKFLRHLEHYFSWVQIRDIVKSLILSDLAEFQIADDKKSIRNAIETGLRQGFFYQTQSTEK